MKRSKFLVVFCFFILFSSQSSAQIAFDTSYHEKVDGDVKQFDHRFRVVLNNEGVAKGDTNFRWELDIISMPEEWDYIFQTPLHCGHMKPVTSGKFYGPIKERAEFSVFFTFYETIGAAELQLRVISLLDSTISDSATFKAEVRDITSIIKLSQEKISIYPNPVIDDLVIQVQEHGTYKILSCSGQIMQKGTLQVGVNNISLHSLSSAYYYISIENRKGNKTFKLLKE